MAKGKRVSNRPGGDPGSRSNKTGDRHYQNVLRSRALAAPGPVTISVPRGMGKTGPARIPGPPRSNWLGRISAPLKRFFRSK